MRRKNKCHYCWETGHNIQTCPTKSAAALQGEPVAQYHVQKKANRIAEGVRCSHCKLSGHNVATCNVKKNEDQKLIADSRETRKTFKEWCEKRSFGIGTLICKPDTTFLSADYGMVVGLNTLLIHARAHYACPILVRWAIAKKNGTVSLPPEIFPDIRSTNHWMIESAIGDFNKQWTDTYNNCWDLTANMIRA